MGDPADFFAGDDLTASASDSGLASDLGPLSIREQRFVTYYLGPANLNAAKAAELAGSKSKRHLNKVGHYWLHRPRVQAEIERRLREELMSPAEICARLSEQAAADIKDFVRLDEAGGPVVDLRHAAETGKTRLIRDVRPTRDGVAIRLHDSQKALALLARIQGLLTVVDGLEEQGETAHLTSAEATAARQAILWVRHLTEAGLAAKWTALAATVVRVVNRLLPGEKQLPEFLGRDRARDSKNGRFVARAGEDPSEG